jgi:hypothetical protein
VDSFSDGDTNEEPSLEESCGIVGQSSVFDGDTNNDEPSLEYRDGFSVSSISYYTQIYHIVTFCYIFRKVSIILTNYPEER